MVCRVGMATDPQQRIAHWKKREGHTYSNILHSNLLYKQALELEKEEAARRPGCRQSAGGPRVPGARMVGLIVRGEVLKAAPG